MTVTGPRRVQTTVRYGALEIAFEKFTGDHTFGFFGHIFIDARIGHCIYGDSGQGSGGTPCTIIDITDYSVAIMVSEENLRITDCRHVDIFDRDAVRLMLYRIPGSTCGCASRAGPLSPSCLAHLSLVSSPSWGTTQGLYTAVRQSLEEATAQTREIGGESTMVIDVGAVRWIVTLSAMPSWVMMLLSG